MWTSGSGRGRGVGSGDRAARLPALWFRLGHLHHFCFDSVELATCCRYAGPDVDDRLVCRCVWCLADKILYPPKIYRHRFKLQVVRPSSTCIDRTYWPQTCRKGIQDEMCLHSGPSIYVYSRTSKQRVSAEHGLASRMRTYLIYKRISLNTAQSIAVCWLHASRFNACMLQLSSHT